jgi:hypothetical protein
VSEELGLQELLGEGGAVDRNERLSRALRSVMNEASDHLLARSRLAGDENRRLRGGHPSDVEQDVPPGGGDSHHELSAVVLHFPRERLDRRLEPPGALAGLGGDAAFLRKTMVREREGQPIGDSSRYLEVGGVVA